MTRTTLTEQQSEGLVAAIQDGTQDEYVAGLIEAAQSEVADAFVAWAMANEIAEPPLDWAGFGQIRARYLPQED